MKIAFDIDGVCCFPRSIDWDFSKAKDIEELIRTAEPNQHILDYIKYLQSKNFRCVLVTGRFAERRKNTEDWLQSHGVVVDKLCMCETDTLDDYFKSKINHIKNEEIDIYYDDLLAAVNAINLETNCLALLYKPGCHLLE